MLTHSFFNKQISAHTTPNTQFIIAKLIHFFLFCTKIIIEYVPNEKINKLNFNFQYLKTLV